MVASIGPFLIDTVAPTSPTVRIDGGAARTSSLVVRLTAGAAEPTNGSGVSEMQFSNNGAAWSSWQPFTSNPVSWNLSAYGGNSNPGTRRVYARYRDRAGNVSTNATDTIVYAQVGIDGITPARGPLIGGETVTIAGSGFQAGSTVVLFDGTPASSVNVSSTSKLTCVTPRHLIWEKVDVRVNVGTQYANRANLYEYVGGRVLSTSNPKLATPFPVVFEAPVDGGRKYAGAASFSTGPTPLPPHNPLPLGFDQLFFLTANNLIPEVFKRIQGTLDATGKATCTVTLPDVPSTVGARFHMAFITLDASKPAGVRTVSAGRTFTIQAK